MSVGFFLTKDMQILPPFRNGQIYMENPRSAESNEKSYFRFSLFSFCVIGRTKLPIRLQIIFFLQKWQIWEDWD